MNISEQAYQYGLEIFYDYVINRKIKFIKELNIAYKKNYDKSFIEWFVEEQGFENLNDAFDFGRFIKTYYNMYNKLPEEITEEITEEENKLLLSLLQSQN